MNSGRPATWLRIGGASAVLGVLVWRVGTGPFIDGVRTINGWSLLAVVAITALTTLCSATRWRVVSAALGVPLTLPTAITGYYRSQFLNSALPGGVLGDVYRGVRHGRDTRDVGRALQAVAWERITGQLVQVVLAIAVLLTVRSPVQAAMPWVLGAVVVVAALVAILARTSDAPSRRSRVRQAIRRDGRALLARGTWPVIVGSSTVAVAGYVSVFLIAARMVDPNASVVRLLPIAMIVLLAMTVPLSIAGWGPREGAGAWAFAAAGLGLDHGVATAAAYGVLSFAATLPGAVVLMAGWVHRRRVLAQAGRVPAWVRPIVLKSAVHG